MKNALPFEFEVPVSFFEKADAGKGKLRRIGGIISTENPDRQGEVVLQNGLDFGDFLRAGWFNDNHSKETTDILGYPEFVKRFRRGEILPNGDVAQANGTWAEGYLLPTPKADKIWELGLALQGTGRHLGYSVEGSIQRRIGVGKKTVAKAKVRNVAVTNCPVNTDSRLDVLAKSLLVVESAEPDFLEKALGMGTTTGPVSQPSGPQSGATAGQVLATESLERGKQARLVFDEEDEEEEAKKSLSDADALAWVQKRIPGISAANAGRIIDLTRALKRRGKL